MAASWGGKNSWGCLRRSRREVSAVRTMEMSDIARIALVTGLGRA
jgi:hypothetical protein